MGRLLGVLSFVGWLGLDEFWRARLVDSREGTSWYHVLIMLVAYRWIDPGAEWRLHRQWFEQSAMGDLLGEGYGLVAKDNLYRCLDKLLAHKKVLFSFLKNCAHRHPGRFSAGL